MAAMTRRTAFAVAVLVAGGATAWTQSAPQAGAGQTQPAGAQSGSAPSGVGSARGAPRVQGQNEHRMAVIHPIAPATAGQAATMQGEDALAHLVKAAGVIFSGEVYAIRMPEGKQNQGTNGGQHSSNPEAVEVEFRVDQGVRGAVIGDPYVLRERIEEWQSMPGLFQLHGRYVVMLEKPDAAGLSRPVEGARGVFSIDTGNNVDLSRLGATSGNRTGTAAQPGAQPPATPSMGTAPPAPSGSTGPKVPDVSTASGEETLVSGSESGQMPELNAASIPYLALMRDLYVLTAAETGGPQGNGTANPAPR